MLSHTDNEHDAVLDTNENLGNKPTVRGLTRCSGFIRGGGSHGLYVGDGR